MPLRCLYQLSQPVAHIEVSSRLCSARLNCFCTASRTSTSTQWRCSHSSNSRLIANVLPVLEELELAISHSEGAANVNDSLLEGVKLIQRKLTTVLESEGVAAIEAVGLMFNPLEHEALGTVETIEVESGYVTQIIRPGFRLHDRVIRPAQVMVAMAPKDP